MNPVEREYLKELLEIHGMELRPGEGEYYLVYDYQENVLARVRNGGFRMKEGINSDADDCIRDAIQKAYKFRTIYERAEDLEKHGVKGYRRLGDFGSTLLAGKLMRDERMEYVVWSYDASGKGVTQGDYFTHLEAAKSKFLERSGILPAGYELITEEEAEELKREEHCAEFLQGSACSDEELEH